jgi:hypothetical protein
MAPSAQDSAIAFFYWELREERAETEGGGAGRYRSPDTAPMKATDKAPMKAPMEPSMRLQRSPDGAPMGLQMAVYVLAMEAYREGSMSPG